MLIDLLPTQPSPTQVLMRTNYHEIATDDLTDSLQNPADLLLKAAGDKKRIGQVGGLSVLEIGPGKGHLTQLLLEAGADVDVLDVVDSYVNLEQFSKCRSKFLGFIDDPGLVELWPSTTRYDCIVMCDVLEHLTHPTDALVNIRRLLKPAGRLYLRVPANEPLVQYAQVFGCMYQLVHLRTYSRSTIKREVVASGFSPEKGPKLDRSIVVPRTMTPGQHEYWNVIRNSLIGDGNRTHKNKKSVVSFFGGFLLPRIRDSHRHSSVVIRLIGLPLRSLFFVGGECWLIAAKGEDTPSRPNA